MTLRNSLLLAALAALALPASAQSSTERQQLSASGEVALRAAVERARTVDRADPRYQSVQATFTVTSAANDGPGSLHDAITQANAAPGLDAIEFAIDGGGEYQEIFLTSLLPLVTDPVTIDGDTQGCERLAGPCIRLDGGALVASEGVLDGGINLLGGGSTVHGLLFTRFFYAEGISALGLRSARNRVTGCLFGTDRAGMVTDPDGVPGSGDELGNGFGIVVNAADEFGGLPATDNVIGDPTDVDRNVIAGSAFSGIAIQGRESTRNVISGNYSGTNAAGTAALGNGESGVLLTDSTHANTISGNVLSGNVRAGVALQLDVENNVVFANNVGTDANGEQAVPNGTLAGLAAFDGIGISVQQSRGNRIEANLISGNLLAGIVLGSANLDGFPGPLVTADNIVRGNLIGADATGELPLPNGVPGVPDVGFGIVFFAGQNVSVTGNRIGGDSTEEDENFVTDANFIVFNTSAGIGAEGPGVSGNVIDGNVIGITFEEEPAPNGQVGILLRNGPRGNRIGRTDPDFEDDILGNVIGYHAIGVALGDFTVGNEIAFNRFGGAPGASLPIDLGLDGPTANDADDPDDGPNRLQNTPTVLSAFSAVGSDEVTVRYLVDTAAANAAYPLTVRFYAQVLDGDVLVHEPLGSATYTEPGEATATIQNSLTVPLAIVATATDADGNTGEASLAGVPVADESAPTVTRGVRVGPNPTAGPVRFAFDLAAPADVSVMVFDALGRRVASVDGRGLAAGPQEMALDAGLAPGLYVWRLRAGDRVETGRLTVVR